MPLLVERRIDMDTGDGFDIFAEEFNDFLEGVGLDAEVVAPCGYSWTPVP